MVPNKIKVSNALHPDSKWKHVWDWLMGLVLIYLAAVIPIDIAFRNWPPRWFYLLIDLMFILDVIISFNTGFRKDGIIIRDRNEVAKQYLYGWFWIELIVAIPWEAIALFSFRMRVSRGIRLARLPKLVSGLRIGNCLGEAI